MSTNNMAASWRRIFYYLDGWRQANDVIARAVWYTTSDIEPGYSQVIKIEFFKIQDGGGHRPPS